MTLRMAVLLASVALLGACATKARTPLERTNPIQKAAEQPFRDLNLARQKISPVLARIGNDPYSQPPGFDCKGVRTEIRELDEVLGPDVDSGEDAPHPTGAVAELAGDALQNAVGVPFRGVIRKISGADEHERDLRGAAMAGLLRRSYLKGLAAQYCKPADTKAPPAPAPIPNPAPPVIDTPKPIPAP